MKKRIRIKDYQCTELEFGRLFADMYGEDIKYNVDTKRYLVWNGEKGVWQIDKFEYAKQTATKFLSEVLPEMAAEIMNDAKRKKYIDYVARIQNNGKVENILKIARLSDDMQITSKELDADPRYFNCINGIYDFKEDKIINHNKGLLITKQSNIIMSDDVEDHTWRDFLFDIANQDEEVQEYLLRMIDYSIQGNPVEHCMFILFGVTTRNGKSTFMKGVLSALGDYGITTQPETISKGSRSASGPRPELVRLQGKRMINIAEPSNNQQLDIGLIKALTGRDTISARGLYADHIEFTNQGVFVMHTNHLPIVDDNTLFTSGRVIVIPFDARFEGNNQDTDMLAKLTTSEAISGLFRDILEVRAEYDECGVKEWLPDKVEEATKEFADKSDYIGWFIRECIRSKQGKWARTKDISVAYNAWAKKTENPSLTIKALTQQLIQRGLIHKHRNSGNGFQDIELK